MSKIELLSPAGNMNALKAAVSAGCDAVYLGGILFGARAFAGNFTNEEIVEAIKYCHLYGVKVYVTCNILIYEHEVEHFLEYIDFLHQNNVDAIIIQDLGMFDLIHQTFPNLEIHISTQAHIHNLDGAIMMKKLGAKRIVLARETPLEEIKKIRKNVSIDIEIFGHGSLCVSYSGQCLFSSLIGNRSGNRGSCVGSCRLPYNIVDSEDNKLNNGDYPLSMKDLNSLEYLKDLIEADVTSLKIEGRMKSMEYVYTVTKLYRMAIDSYYQTGRVFVDKKELDNLKRIFNREFTKGYLFNEEQENIINSKRPNHQGIYLGKVIKSDKNKIYVKLADDVSIHDGIRIILDKEDYGLELNEFYINDKLVKEAKKSDIISFKVNKNIPLYSQVLLTKDSSLISEIENKIANSRKVLISGEIFIQKNKPLTLTIDDGIHKVSHEGSVITPSINHPITKEIVYDKLTKLGDTIYEFKELKINLDENVFVSLKELNTIRREVINELNNLRLYQIPYEKKEYHRIVNNYEKVTKKSILVDKIKEKLNYDSIYSNNDDDKAIIHLSNVMDNYNQLDQDKEYLVGEIGAFNKLKNIYCDYTFNVTNSYTVALLHSLKAKRITLSLELTPKQVFNIISEYEKRYNAHPNLEVVVEGRRKVMTLKTNLNKIYQDNISLVDVYHNHYPIIQKNNLSYIYDYQYFKDKYNYYQIGINYVRSDKEI